MRCFKGKSRCCHLALFPLTKTPFQGLCCTYHHTFQETREKANIVPMLRIFGLKYKQRWISEIKAQIHISWIVLRKKWFSMEGLSSRNPSLLSWRHLYVRAVVKVGKQGGGFSKDSGGELRELVCIKMDGKSTLFGCLDKSVCTPFKCLSSLLVKY